MATTEELARQVRGEQQPPPAGGQVERRETEGPTVYGMVSRQLPALARALPRHIPAEMYTQTVLTLVRLSEGLQKSTPESLAGALLTCAQLGLIPGPQLGEAHLVPFFNGRSRRHEVQTIIGYQGLTKLALNSGHVASVEAHVVREGDVFEYSLGDDPRIVHVPGEDDTAPGVRYYAIATGTAGGKVRRVMSRAAVMAHRDQYVRKLKDDSPWHTAFDEMAKKTVVRAVCKVLPKSPTLAVALATDGTVRNVTELDLATRPVFDLGEIPVLDAAPEGGAADA